ncbi:MAG: B12-binding domain-containing radical SAM protein [Candidatus Aenigmarchaeota archaeon]|nr:B12-binding domain-containing radical SAM protein [Candidatus Aenigmarchaeota archaeon]
MADILAIYPKTGFDIKNASVELPLGLISTVSAVHEDYEVKILDQRVDENFERNFLSELSKEPSIVLIPSMTGTQIKYALEASRFTKENSKAKVLWGGVHATLMPQQTIQHPLIDAIVIGEGEFVMKEFMEAVNGKREMDFVNGIAYKNSHVKFTEHAPSPDPNEIPELPYHLVNVENYVKAGGIAFSTRERTLPFISSRGCPYTCKFCSTAGIAKGKWRSMTAELTYERVKNMARKYKIDVVKFYDENFTSNPKRAETIAELINGEFGWSMQARMDNMLITDMKKLEEGGLRVVEPGIESGSDRILKLVNKAEDRSAIISANRKLAQTNIKAFYNFMMGFPSETKEEIMETVDLALQIIKENPNAHITQFYIFTPYLGAPLFDYAVENGFEVPHTLEGWIAFSRQHTYTPWIQDKLELYESIMYTSKFVDGKRLSQVLRNSPVPKFFIQALSNRYKKNWEKHKFEKTASVKLLELMIKRKFGWGN